MGNRRMNTSSREKSVSCPADMKGPWLTDTVLSRGPGPIKRAEPFKHKGSGDEPVCPAGGPQNPDWIASGRPACCPRFGIKSGRELLQPSCPLEPHRESSRRRNTDHKMSASLGGKPLAQSHGAKDAFVRVRKRDLERLTTEVMQLRDFLPRVLNLDLTEMLHQARTAETVKKQLVQEQEQLRQECVHLQSRLDAVQSDCQREREEKLLLSEQLWQSGAELQQQADFCSGLGSAACSLLWSCSGTEDTVTRWLVDGKLQAFLAVAAQTLESFVRSLDAELKTQTEDQDSQEHRFVLAVAGTITNIAAVPCGRDFLSSSAPALLDTLMKLLQLMKPGVFPKLKVLMLMALYNISISVKGLKLMSESPGLLPLIWTLLNDQQSHDQRSHDQRSHGVPDETCGEAPLRTPGGSDIS
ncbi:heat shock factor 2-binding protein isoform X2 [Trachinotus anak]|uniref:heat shock factor 2-binding protein isoform X2 n=1 Tax=Trachinotus anak TaxID=443729 RepID=UPI0039F254F4